MLSTCAICGALIWRQRELCLDHQGFAELQGAVESTSEDRRSDWDDGRLLSHKEMQLQRPNTGPGWLTIVDDINRMARYWLDGWHGDGGDNESGGGIAA